MDDHERELFLEWWKATGGGNTSLQYISMQAFVSGARLERKACIEICREIAGHYPLDIFPDNGSSIDCKTARMARITSNNIEHKITKRYRKEK